MRISSVDTLKTFAMLAIVAIHTRPFSGTEFSGSPFFSIIFYFINQVSRFAVPFFFAASGYFFARSVERGGGPWSQFFRYSKRLAVVFAVWTVIYGVIPPNWTTSFFQMGPAAAIWKTASMNLARAAEAPLTFLVNGAGVHLWFLPALIIAMFILTISAWSGLSRYTILLGIVLYIMALAAGPYSSLLGVDLPFNGRNGPFFSTFFVSAGWWLSKRDAPGFKTALALIVAGAVVQTAEVVVLNALSGLSPDSHDYLVGSAFTGLGAFMLCLASPDLGRSTFLPPLGRFTLGVYVSHLLIKASIYPALHDSLGIYTFQFAYPAVVYLLSVVLTAALLKTPLARHSVL
jgi:surface polysaccharide O-acyltransferase-like enzyme